MKLASFVALLLQDIRIRRVIGQRQIQENCKRVRRYLPGLLGMRGCGKASRSRFQNVSACSDRSGLVSIIA